MATRQERQLKSQAPPLGAALTYRDVLWSMLDKLNARILELILSTWEEEHPDARADAVQSSYTTRVIGDLELAVEEMIDPTLADKVGYVAERVNQHGKAEFARVIGIKTHDLGVGSALGSFRDRNVDLIKSLGQDQLGGMRELLERAQAGAWKTSELRKELMSRFGVTKSKADLLARDQTLKLNGQLTMTRQRNAGITKYIWTTSRDERVRPMHAELDGTTQEWSSPPIVSKDNRRCHPGDDFQCRCTAYPILEELEEELDPEFMPDKPLGEEVKGFHPLDKEVSWQGMLSGVDMPEASLSPQEAFPFAKAEPKPVRPRRAPGPGFAITKAEPQPVLVRDVPHSGRNLGTGTSTGSPVTPPITAPKAPPKPITAPKAPPKPAPEPQPVLVRDVPHSGRNLGTGTSTGSPVTAPGAAPQPIATPKAEPRPKATQKPAPKPKGTPKPVTAPKPPPKPVSRPEPQPVLVRDVPHSGRNLGTGTSTGSPVTAPTPARETAAVSNAQARTLDYANHPEVKEAMSRIDKRTLDWVAREGKLDSISAVTRKQLQGAGGHYDPTNGGQIRVVHDYSPKDYGEKFEPGGTWSLHHAAPNKMEAIRATFLHELGHHIHIGPAESTVYDLVESVYNARTKTITKYAGTNAMEYFAESFASYHIRPAELLAHDPAAFDMVEKVLKIRGIQ